MLVEAHAVRHERPRKFSADTWRIFRDYFYDPSMHGVDWKAIRAKYEAMLPACVTREDLNYLIAEMISRAQRRPRVSARHLATSRTSPSRASVSRRRL
jgi:hypothetical protein